MKKRAVAAALACALALCMAAGCARTEREFLPGYELEDCTTETGDGATVGVGRVDFESMLFHCGGDILPYRLYVPYDYDEEKEYPLLLFLHGAGERGSDNVKPISTYDGFDSFFDEEDDPALDAIVLVPQCPYGQMWVEAGEAENGQYSTEEVAESAVLGMVLRLVKYTAADYSVDRARIYAMGMSMGGYATWDILARHTDLLAAAVPICGGCDVAAAERIKDIPIHTFHGALDPIVPPDGTRAMAAALREAGAPDFVYTEYADGMHDIWNRAMQTEGLDDWLFAQSRN